VAIDLLRRLDASARPVLLVVDGLDEAAGWNFPRALLPEMPHPGLRVLVSARELRGDCGAEGWRGRLGWDRGAPPWTIEIDPLDADGVAEVLRNMGAAFADAENAEVSAQIVRLTGGDPLLVRLYTEDLRTRSDGPGRLHTRDLASLQPGFGPFFRGWLRDQKEIWALRERPIDVATLDVILALLACALGRLRHADLAEVYRCWRGIEFTLSTEALEPIGRFILGDGGKSGYVLTHPKLGDFLREEHFADPLVPRRAREAFLRWGLKVLSALEEGTLAPEACPAYLTTYFGQHLSHAEAPVENFMRLVGLGWLRAWRASEGGYRGFSQDVRRAADAIEERAGGDGDRWTWRLRCHLVMSSISSIGSQIPGWLVTECVKTGKLTWRQGLYWLEQQGNSDELRGTLELIASQTSKVEALVALARELPQTGDRTDGLAEILRVTCSIDSEWARADALQGMALCLPEVDALRAALAMSSDEQRAKVLTPLAPRVQHALLAEALRAELTTPQRRDDSKTITILAGSLPVELRRATFALAASEAEGNGGPAVRVRIMTIAAAHLPEVERVDCFVAVLKTLIAVDDQKARGELLAAIAPHLPELLLADGVQAAAAIGDEASRLSAFATLAPRLSGSLLTEAAKHSIICAASYSHARALTAIAARITDGEEGAALFKEAIKAVDALQDDPSVLWMLPMLAMCTSDENERTAILSRALRVVEAIGDEYQRARQLETIARYLSPPLAADALRLVTEIKDELAHFNAFRGVTEHIPEALLPAAFEIAKTIKSELHRDEALSALVSKLPEDLLPEAFEAASPSLRRPCPPLAGRRRAERGVRRGAAASDFAGGS
jgi:hypothetical protein